MMTVVIENKNSDRKIKEYTDVVSVRTQPVQTFMYVIRFKDGSEITFPSDAIIVNRED